MSQCGQITSDTFLLLFPSSLLIFYQNHPQKRPLKIVSLVPIFFETYKPLELKSRPPQISTSFKSRPPSNLDITQIWALLKPTIYVIR